MAKKDIEKKVKPKTLHKDVKKDIKKSVSKKGSAKAIKQKIKNKTNKIREKINIKILISIIFITAVLLVFSSYAWLSTSLNVKVKFFDLVVATDRGLFISLDGINFSESVEVSLDSIINDLRATYPNHTNQWSTNGLWPISSNGIRSPNNDKFDVFVGTVVKYKERYRDETKYLRTVLSQENRPAANNIYVAFDVFLKNASGSPKNDNLFFNENTYIDFAEGTSDEVAESMSGIMNSMRIGIVKVGTVNSNSPATDIQNMKCNGACEQIIYEPNSLSHSSESIDRLRELGINVVDGQYMPTYAVIREGTHLEHTNGQVGSGFPLDTTHFALQTTRKDFEDRLFEIPNGITKMRVYVWIEGQDVDSLETHSKGANLAIVINFEKDLAGYD